MSPTTLLLGLLALAYFGSILMGGRSLRGYGLPSGTEYVLLGLAAGPHVIGAVERSTLSMFEPIVAMCTSWLALVVGSDYGHFGDRRVSLKGTILGLVIALLTAAATGAAAFYAMVRLTPIRGTELILTAGGIALVSSETTQHATRWVVERYGARGKLCDLLADAADADDAVPLLGLGALFAFGPAAMEVSLPLRWWGAELATLGLGVGLGAVAAILLRVEANAADGWGVLLGAALVATGVAWRLGWSALTVLFTMGIALSALSRHRAELRSMLMKTERPVMLPTLLVAGALIRIERWPILLALVGAAFLPRLVVKLFAGALLRAVAGAPRGSGGAAGLGLLSTGGLTVVVGVAYALRFPGAIGERVLAVAAALTIVGELIGPGSLRRALVRAGEIESEAPAPAASEVAA